MSLEALVGLEAGEFLELVKTNMPCFPVSGGMEFPVSLIFLIKSLRLHVGIVVIK